MGPAGCTDQKGGSARNHFKEGGIVNGLSPTTLKADRCKERGESGRAARSTDVADNGN